MGINMNDAFPSKWLKADDIDGDTPVTIQDVQMQNIGDDERKPVIWFREFDKGMVLNKTNATNVSSLYGPDSDAWIGRPMTLATAMVDFQGKSTRALRLYPPPRQSKANASVQTSHQRPLNNEAPAGAREFAPLEDDPF